MATDLEELNIALFGGPHVLMPSLDLGECHIALFGGPHVLLAGVPPLQIQIEETINFAESLTHRVWLEGILEVTVEETINFHEQEYFADVEIAIEESLNFLEGGSGVDLTIPGLTTDAHCTLASYYPWKAIDNNEGNFWESMSHLVAEYPECWWEIDLGIARKVTKIRLLYNDANPSHSIKEFELLGSNTGTFGGEETSLIRVADLPGWGNPEWRSWEFTNDTAFRYYRVKIWDSVGGEVLHYALIGEVELIDSSVPYVEIGAVIPQISETLNLEENIGTENPLEISVEETITFEESLFPGVTVPAPVEISVAETLTFAEGGSGKDVTRPGMVCSAHDEYYPDYDHLAIDNDESNMWAGGPHAATDYPLCWWGVDLGVARKVTKVRILFNGGTSHCLEEFELLASNTGTFGGEETSLLHPDGLSEWTAPEWREWEFENDTAFRYYRVVCWRTFAPIITYPQLGEIELIDTTVPYVEIGTVVPQVSETLRFEEFVSTGAPVTTVDIAVEETLSFEESVQASFNLPISIQETINFEESLTSQVAAVLASIETTINFEISPQAFISELFAFQTEELAFQEDVQGQVGTLLIEIQENLVFAETLSPEVILQEIVTDPFMPDGYDTWEDENVRFIIPATKLKGRATSRIQVRLSYYDREWSFTSLYIGTQANSGDPYDFNGGQVEVTFNGGQSGGTVGVGGLTSDVITFTLSKSKPTILAFFFTGEQATPHDTSATGYDLYYKFGSDETAITNVSDYIQPADYYFSRFVEFIMDVSVVPVDASVSEALVFSEAPLAQLGDLRTEVYETISFELVPGIDVGDLWVSISEALNLAEETTVQVPNLFAEVSETINFDFVSQAQIPEILAEISENLTIIEPDLFPEISELLVTVQENIVFEEVSEQYYWKEGELLLEELLGFGEEISGQIGALEALVSETITFGMSPNGEVGETKAEVSETIWVSDEVFSSPPDVMIEVSEEVQIGDFALLTITDLETIAAEALNFEENFSGRVGDLLTIQELTITFSEADEAVVGTVLVNVLEDLIFSDEASVSTRLYEVNQWVEENICFGNFSQAEIGPVIPQLVDSINFSTVATVDVGNLEAFVTETINFEESVQPVFTLPISVQETINFEEQVASDLSALNIAITEIISFAETISGRVEELRASVSDSVNIAEDLKPAVAALSAQVTDALQFAEGMVQRMGDTGAHVQEELKVGYTGQVIALINDLRTQIAESLIISERPLTEYFGPVDISILENINFTEMVLPQILFYAVGRTFKKEFLLDDRATSFEIPERKTAFDLPKGEFL